MTTEPIEGVKISRVAIENYRGIRALQVDVPPAGAEARGWNGSGKTSFLNAIRAALISQDVKADAITLGEDKAMIVININELTVRLGITQSGKTLTVKDEKGRTIPSPQKYLTELLGESPVDPLKLLLAEPKDRRAVLMAAMPITVTRAELDEWVPGLPKVWNDAGHGLEVVERARMFFFEQRKEANAKSKAAAEARDRIAAAVPPITPDMVNAPPVEVAQDRLVAAEDVERQAIANARAMETAISAQRAGHERVTELRKQAATIVLLSPEEADAQHVRMAALKEKLEEVRALFVQLTEEHETLTRTINNENRASSRHSDLVNQADLLEKTLLAPSDGPSKETLDALAAEVSAALCVRNLARAASDAVCLQAAANLAELDAKAAAEEAARLDGHVKKLTREIPDFLMARSGGGIPGLAIVGDDIRYNDVVLEKNCGAEQVRICVAIAKALNGKSKLLIVDGLERLDGRSRGPFVQEAVRDGWQLIASCVADQECELVGYESVEAAQ